MSAVLVWVAIGVGLEAGNGVIVSVMDAVVWVGMEAGLEVGKAVMASVMATMVGVGKVEVDVTFAHAVKLMDAKSNVPHLYMIRRRYVL